MPAPRETDDRDVHPTASRRLARPRPLISAAANMLSTRCTLVVLISLVYLENVSSFGISSPFYLQRLHYETSSKSLFAVNPRFARSNKLASPRMSDMSDMTIEMLKRLERTLDQLSETDLIRVRTLSELVPVFSTPAVLCCAQPILCR